MQQLRELYRQYPSTIRLALCYAVFMTAKQMGKKGGMARTEKKRAASKAKAAKWGREHFVEMANRRKGLKNVDVDADPPQVKTIPVKPSQANVPAWIQSPAK